MIGLLSGPSAVLAADEAAARRASAHMEAKDDPTPIDAVRAPEPAGKTESATTGERHPRQELTTDERLRQDEALHDVEDAAQPNPDATIEKMRQVRRDALTADPASQDHTTAAKAAQVIRAAEAELAARRQETLREAAADIREARQAAIENARGRDLAGADAPQAAAHQLSEYVRQAVMSAGSRLSSVPPPPPPHDESI